MEEEEEEEEKEEEEEEEDEEEVQGTDHEGKIFHLPEDIFTSFRYFVCFFHRLALTSSPPSQFLTASVEYFQQG